ncbi:MAG: FkbM family methyltransferase, partial [Methanobrevibacter sp.]|nr:FkbM family methyltransferase [Candidatus Methanovirga basalitermitum]
PRPHPHPPTHPRGGGGAPPPRDNIQVKVKTLTDVIKELDLENIDIHFCKIDVETFEKEVLESINFDMIRPMMFVVESTIPGTNINIHDEWENILIDNNYSFSLQQGVNRYYIDKNQEFLSINKINNLKDVFRILKNKYDILYVSSNDYPNFITFKIGKILLFPLEICFTLFKYIKFKL